MKLFANVHWFKPIASFPRRRESIRGIFSSISVLFDTSVRMDSRLRGNDGEGISRYQRSLVLAPLFLLCGFARNLFLP
jgi:hypothetical protein